MTRVSCAVAARCSAVRARSCRPMASACAARRSRKSWMSGWRAWPASSLSSPSSGQSVECGGGVGEEVGESAQQGGGLLDRGRRAEPGEQWLPGGEVHQAPGAIEVAARPVGAADGRHREPASREVALHGGLERGGGGVGHDPGDEATFELGGRVAELDGVHLGPEPAGERCGWDRPRHGGSVRVSAQRGEQAVGGRVVRRDHAVPDVSGRGERRRGGWRVFRRRLARGRRGRSRLLAAFV